MKFANRIGYSDVTPYEVIKKISEKTIAVRRMRYERDDSVELKFAVGGFAAHCVNQSQQKWVITPDESAPEFRIRLGKSGWKSASGAKFVLSDEPKRFYDYNF